MPLPNILNFFDSKNTSIENTKQNPAGCIAQILIDSVLLCAVYSFLSYHLGKGVPNFDQMATFLAVYSVVVFVFKVTASEFHDLVSRACVMFIGNLLIQGLQPV